MSFETTALLLLVCMAGAVVQSTTGFGFGVVVMSVLPYLMSDYFQATAISGLGALTISVIISYRDFKKARFKVIIPLTIGYIISSTAAIILAKGFSSAGLTRALGAALIAVSIYFMFFNNKIKIKPSFKNGVIAGLTAGVGAGLFSIGGPPAVIYLLSAIDDKEQYRACSLTYFSFSGIYSSVVRYLNGYITPEVISAYAMSVAALVLGCYIGNKIFHRINADMLKKFIYGFMAISGLTMLF